MRLADNEILPPKEWQHDPNIKNNYGETVAMILASKGILPPKEWLIYNNKPINGIKDVKDILSKK